MTPFIFEVLQASISPVVLISGVGLLLLSMSNRYARIQDRSRELVDEAEDENCHKERALLVQQIRILYARGKLLRISIMCAASCIFFVSLTILCIFLYKLTALAFLTQLVLIFFCVSILALSLATATFIRDITLSLNALKLEVDKFLHDEEKRS